MDKVEELKAFHEEYADEFYEYLNDVKQRFKIQKFGI